MQVCVLGRIAVVADGEKETVLGANREAALLADLIVHAGRVVPSSRLVDDLWHGTPSPGAASTLQTYVKNLRRVLAPGHGGQAGTEVIATVRPGYVLRIEPDAVDAWRCERLVVAARSTLPGDPGRAAGMLTDALALCRGPAFGALAAEPFLEAEAARLDELQVVAFELRVDADLALGRHDRVAGELQAATAAHPYRESLWRQWMLALYRCGRQAEALRAYQQLRRALEEDLGIEPSAPLRELELAILQQRPELDRVTPAAEVMARFPSPAPIGQEPDDGGAAFVGRRREHDEAVARLRAAAQPGAPTVVTLTGPGGVGKTRLARRVASESGADFPGGWRMVDLVTVPADSSVGDIALAAVGGERPPGRGVLDALRDVGRQSRPLVVLDNCEHVIPATRDVVGALLAGGCSVLATSREPLGLPGERVIPLTGLEDDDAVDLYLEAAARAGSAAEPAEDAVVELCRRLDGLPLAIELAAARSRALSVSEMIDRVGERFRLLRGGPDPRHRTLHESMKWSFDLLEPRQQQLFARLSVFRGGCDLAAATDVAAAPGADELDVLDDLGALVARSVVVADVGATSTRYRLLETLRDFGAQQLTEPESSAVARRHVEYFVAFAETAGHALLGCEPEPARNALVRDWDNLRAAVGSATATGDVDSAVRLALACCDFGSRALRHEVAEWCERVLRLDGVEEHARWSDLAAVTATLRRDAGDLSGAEQLVARALARVQHDDGPGFRLLAASFGMAWSHGDLTRAAELVAPIEDRAPADPWPDAIPIAYYLRLLVALLADTEDPVAVAEEAWQRALRSQRPSWMAFAALGLLAVDIKLGRGTRRGELFDEVLHWSARVGDRKLQYLASLWMLERRTDSPEVTLSYGRHTLFAARDEGQWAAIDVTVRRIVPVLVALGRYAIAGTLLGALTTIESALHDLDLTPLEEAERTLREELGADLDWMMRRGATMPRAELVTEVLAEIDAAIGPDDGAG